MKTNKIPTTKFARKPFYVDVPDPVSAENMKELAEWCGGEIRTEGTGPNARQYIKVKVTRPQTVRQTKAFIGDRILFAGNGYKVYTPKAFEKSFSKVKHLSKAEAQKAGIRPPIEPKRGGIPRNLRPEIKADNISTETISAEKTPALDELVAFNQPDPGELKVTDEDLSIAEQQAAYAREVDEADQLTAEEILEGLAAQTLNEDVDARRA